MHDRPEIEITQQIVEAGADIEDQRKGELPPKHNKKAPADTSGTSRGDKKI